MNILETRAIVLQTHVLREADLMLVLLSVDFGRISAIARSAKKSRKRFMGGFDVFDCGLFQLAEPKTHEQPYLVEAISKRELWPALREDLFKFSAACFCVEVTLPFVHENDLEARHLYHPLHRCLRAIQLGKTNDEALTLALYFNLLLLKISGFNFLEDGSRIKVGSELNVWLSEMFEKQTPIVPYDRSLLKLGFQAVVVFTQEILGKEIRSARELS